MPETSAQPQFRHQRILRMEGMCRKVLEVIRRAALVDDLAKCRLRGQLSALRKHTQAIADITRGIVLAEHHQIHVQHGANALGIRELLCTESFHSAFRRST